MTLGWYVVRNTTQDLYDRHPSFGPSQYRAFTISVYTLIPLCYFFNRLTDHHISSPICTVLLMYSTENFLSLLDPSMSLYNISILRREGQLFCCVSTPVPRFNLFTTCYSELSVRLRFNSSLEYHTHYPEVVPSNLFVGNLTSPILLFDISVSLRPII